MGENSLIEWTDHTFNPWEGCTKVSDGCKFCYAEARAYRFNTVEWGPIGTRRRTSAANWKKPLKWDKEAAQAGKRARVFCASIADVFEIKADQPELNEWRLDLFELINHTPNLIWQLLTKRPENVNPFLDLYGLTLPDNVWIGTSVENQEQAEKRIPELVKVMAKVRFLSMEPLLGAVDLACLGIFPFHGKVMNLPSCIDWVIVGGESGPNARPLHPDWVRSIRDQCVEAGVPFFFKQWGEWGPYYSEKIVRVGKKKAGRMLDGRTWDQFPTEEV